MSAESSRVDGPPPDEPALSRRALLRGKFLAGLLPTPQDGAGPELPETPAAFSPSIASSAATPSPELASRRRAFPVLRPPGAVREEDFLEHCTRCGACIEACPHDAIVLAPPRFRQAAGTPMIDPHAGPCRVCGELPCVAACQTPEAGCVLRWEIPLRMGTAEIQPWNCLAHQQSLGLAACSACVEQCPVPGAIEVVDNRPRIRPETCVGCGVCHHVCPAPQNAVIVLPTAVRPGMPAARESSEPPKAGP